MGLTKEVSRGQTELWGFWRVEECINEAEERKRRDAGVTWELLPPGKGKINVNFGENISS